MYDSRVKAELLCVGRFLALRFGLHFSNFVLPRFPGSRKTAQTQEESTDMYKGTVGSHLPSGVCVWKKSSERVNLVSLRVVTLSRFVCTNVFGSDVFARLCSGVRRA